MGKMGALGFEPRSAGDFLEAMLRLTNGLVIGTIASSLQRLEPAILARLYYAPRMHVSKRVAGLFIRFLLRNQNPLFGGCLDGFGGGAGICLLIL